jgi:hypothetical protein
MGGTRVIATPPRHIQREFDLKLPTGRPLVPIEAIMVLLDKSEDDILNLIECGFLRWAFDISTPPPNLEPRTSNVEPGRRRRELRVYRESVLDYLHDAHQQPPYYSFEPEPTLERVITVILPPGTQPTLMASKFARRLTCSSQHVLNLIDAQVIPTITVRRRGPNGSPLIERSGARAFLRSRCAAVLTKNGKTITLHS